MRGQKASIHVYQDVLQLCEVIEMEGQTYNDEEHKMILFGDLFQVFLMIYYKKNSLILIYEKIVRIFN